MAIDREETLKKAEKLLRQGRLDAAIVEYQRVTDEYPRDWNTANTLGDCFYRAHQVERAVEQFNRIADHFAQEGFFPKAAALYKKSLKVKPDDEHALTQAAEIAIRQGTLVEAKQYLAALAERRRMLGDAHGAADSLLRIGALDPDDLEARLAAARAVAAAGGGDRVAGEFRDVAEALAARGREDQALEVLVEAARLAPNDQAIRAGLASRYAARGAADRARAHLDALGEINDPGLLQLVAELRADAGEHELARGLFARLLAREPHVARAIAERGAALAASSPEAALVRVESAAETLLLHGDFAAAADAYESFLHHQPGHVAASLRLVEICVDGDLETLVTAQTALTDAYLAAGRGAEARAVAEDLVANHPADAEHVDRLRRALVLVGERDVEGAIAERLSAGSAAAGDLGIDLSDEPDAVPGDAAETSWGQPATGDEPLSPVRADDDAASLTGPAEARQPRLPPAARDPFGLGPIAIDLGDILGEDLEDAAGGEGQADGDAAEVDLSDALSRLKGASPAPARQPATLDGLFTDFRDEVDRQSKADAAEQHFKVGLTYDEMGMVPEAMKELEIAVRAPRLRFEAASRLARLALKRGRPLDAIEWFERAAEAPAPTAEAGRTLLYDLGDTLEAGGETARALAVFLELQADASDFRDVARRVERLARVQAGG